MCASAAISDLKLLALFVWPLSGKRKVLMLNWFKAIGLIFGFIGALALLTFLAVRWSGFGLIYLGAALVYWVYTVKGVFDYQDETERVRRERMRVHK
jgi:uncharacterized membrane protein